MNRSTLVCRCAIATTLVSAAASFSAAQTVPPTIDGVNVIDLGVVGKASFDRPTRAFFESDAAFDAFNETFPTSQQFAVIDVSFCDGSHAAGTLDPFDTHAGIWRNTDGTLIAESDDACSVLDTNVTPSAFLTQNVPSAFLFFPLPEGDYTVSISAANAILADGFTATAAASGEGDWSVAVADVINGIYGIKTASGSCAAGEVDYIRFTIEADTPVAGCPADFATPYGMLNSSDINAFVFAILSGDLAADLDGSGGFDATDVNMFVASFVAGC